MVFVIRRKDTEVMKTFNQTVANHPQLESILIPISDGVTVVKVKSGDKQIVNIIWICGVLWKQGAAAPAVELNGQQLI
ncbi:methyltransferase [Bacillus atrophaeus]|nr:methyltransferase [Bacillus atrophaeus]